MRRLIPALALLLLISCSKDSSGPTDPGGGGGNRAPTIYVSVDSTRLSLTNATLVHVTASDLDGDQLTFAYAAVGGSVTASGPTATSATFTAAVKGNASVTVTASDGHGGSAVASAALYLVPKDPPSNVHTKYACSFTWTPGESLTVLGGEFHTSGGTTYSIEPSPPFLVTSYVRVSVEGSSAGSNCPATTSYGLLTVQRPLPDGRSYSLVFN